MKILLLITLINLSLYAQESNANICEWLGDAAIVVAQNRDNGIGEYDLINKYLEQDASYGEQNVVITLIDRVYHAKKDLAPEEVALAERKQCEIAMVVRRSQTIK